jgi:MFS family permease
MSRLSKPGTISHGSIAIATVAAVFLGLGTALVYPTLIAAMSDAVSPVERAPVVDVYRFWRDSGYALGGIIAGGVADALGYGGAIVIVAALTAVSGLWVLGDMPSDHRVRRHLRSRRAEARPAR